MGMVKNWLIKQAEDERDEEIREWWRDRTGRKPQQITVRMVEEFELAEALAHALSKDD